MRPSPSPRRLLVVLATPLLLASCLGPRAITIQTLQPSEFSLPADFQRPLVLANLYAGRPSDLESMAQAALDSIAADGASAALAEILGHSPAFQDAQFRQAVHFRTDVSRYILTLPWGAIDSIVAAHEADLIISLEYIRVRPRVQAYEYWDGQSIMNYGSLSMAYHAFWRVYHPSSQAILAPSLLRDTLVWQYHDTQPVRVGHQLPGFFASAAYCGQLIGSEYALLIAPSWADEQRIYYASGSREMRQAARLARQYQWLRAAALWQAVYNHPKSAPRLAARAAFNLALANELHGNFDVALEWLSRSEAKRPNLGAPWYRDALQERLDAMSRFLPTP